MTIILIKVIRALLGRQVWRGFSVQFIKPMSWSLADTFHPGMMEWVSHRLQSSHGFQWGTSASSWLSAIDRTQFFKLNQGPCSYVPVVRAFPSFSRQALGCS